MKIATLYGWYFWQNITGMHPGISNKSKTSNANAILRWLILGTVLISCQIHSVKGEAIPIELSKSSISSGDSIIRILSYNFDYLQSNTQIRALHASSNGQLLILTNNDILWFDGKEITRRLQPKKLNLSAFNRIAEDLQGNIWLWHFLPDRNLKVEDVVVYVLEKNKLLNQSEIISDILEAPKNTTAIRISALNSGEILINTSDGNLYLLNNFENIRKIEFNWPARFMAQHPDNMLLLLIKFQDNYQLLETDLKGNILRESPYVFSSPPSYCIYNGDYLNCAELSDNKSYIRSLKREESGLKINSDYITAPKWENTSFSPFFVNRQASKYNFFTLVKDGFKPFELLSTVVKDHLNNSLPATLLETESGMWVGVSNTLIHISTAPSHFNSILNDAVPQTVSFRKISYQSDSSIFAASYRGFYQLKSNPSGKLTTEEVDTLLHSCSGLYVHSFLKSPNIPARVYFFMDRMKIADLNKGDCFITVFEGGVIREIWDVLHIDGPYLYIATDAGLFIYHEFEETFHRLEIKTSKGTILDRTVNRIHYLKDQHELVLASELGLIIVQIDPEKPLNITTTAHIKLDCNVNDALFIDDDRLLISSWDRGLFLISVPDYEIIQNFNSFNFLSSNATHNLTKDTLGRIWFSANNGLYVMDPDKLIIREFNIINGLQEREFNHLAMAVPPNWDQPMIYGGVNGITYFFPHEFEVFNYFEPKDFLKIQEVNAGKNKPVRKKADLDNGENYFHVSGRSDGIQLFHTMDYLPAQIEIHYRQKDSEGMWQMADRGKIPINKLKSGSNKLEFLFKLPNNGLLLTRSPVEIYKGQWFPKYTEIWGWVIGLCLLMWGILKAVKKQPKFNSVTNHKPYITNLGDLFEIEIVEEENPLPFFNQRLENIEKSFFKSLPHEMADFRKQLRESIDQVDDFSQFSIVDMAALVHVSIRGLNRKVESAFRTTPHKYLVFKKMLRSRILLQNEKKISLLEVSNQMGYMKAGYFSKQFEKYYGLQPMQYQKQYFDLLHQQELKNLGKKEDL